MKWEIGCNRSQLIHRRSRNSKGIDLHLRSKETWIPALTPAQWLNPASHLLWRISDVRGAVSQKKDRLLCIGSRVQQNLIRFIERGIGSRMSRQSHAVDHLSQVLVNSALCRIVSCWTWFHVVKLYVRAGTECYYGNTDMIAIDDEVIQKVLKFRFCVNMLTF